MPETPIQLVLVDFDDTLVDTAPRFHNARLELFRLLVETGFPEPDVYRVHHDEVDPAMREQFGFGPHRLEYSFRATYETLCNALGHQVDDVVADRAARLGKAVAGPPPLLAGAVDALRRLNDALPTALYTQSGDLEYQMGCVQACGLLEILPVDRVVIAAHKTTAEFGRVLDSFSIADPAGVWMIGNSMRHDINPALEAGANAIFVEVADPWEFDVVPPVSDTFHTVRSFPAAVDLLLAGQES